MIIREEKICRSIKLIIASSSIIFILLIGGCNHMIAQTGEKHIKKICDIAYDVTGLEDCIVHIEENGAFVPYLVISSNYMGNTLLLRQYLLNDPMPFNKNETHMWSSYQYGGYYENSSIDDYLNTGFIDMLSQSVKGRIIDCNIVITDKSSLGVTGNTTKTILRKVFILSLRELNGAESSASASEGNTIKFFADDNNRRVANLVNGEKSAYWTRTPETWETYNVFTIGDGGTGSGSADIESGVRPAFCLPRNTAICESNMNGANISIIQD